ncbi:MAG TPA: FliI/YscN family ATPase [Terracidiphilus sp.]
MSELLDRCLARLGDAQPWRWRGQVLESVGNTIESAGPVASVGECCTIEDRQGNRYLAEVIGFRGSHVISMPLMTTEGIRFGDAVTALGSRPSVQIGNGMIGRVLNGMGMPIEGEKRIAGSHKTMRLDGSLRAPLDRMPIRVALATGIRTLDGLLTVGRGQRVGVFGGSGVGKSTLIGIMTRNTEADITVVGLVGERGREVREFVEDALGKEGLARAVVVVSTSDESPLMRMRAALTATAIAEYFAAEGKAVLLVLDSLTRFAMAAREIGLAAGEPPTAKGYTPSVFSRLAKLVERAGNFRCGSITAFYTVLMEGDDQQDPLVDAVRSLLDGHVVLSRKLAAEGWYPPIDLLDSISRLMPAIADKNHLAHAALFRRMMASYARSEDLVRIGAYKAGADPELDRALRAQPAMREFMVQNPRERIHFADCLHRLATVTEEI